MDIREKPHKLGHSLLGRRGRVVRKVNALCDVVLEPLVGCFEELLLVVVGLADDVDSVLNTVGLLRVSKLLAMKL